MAILNILEFGRGTEFPVVPLTGRVQNVDFVAGVTSAAAFGSNTHGVYLNPDTTCRVLVGDTVGAGTGIRLPADTQTFWEVPPEAILTVITSAT